MSMTDVCLSGGADGADLQWGMCAGMAGHTVVHWSFTGHRTKAPKEEVVVLSGEQLMSADPFLLAAAPKLKKGYRVGRDPASQDSFVANLLRRNWFQVGDAERVYAVATIKDGIVQGGTAWATQMFIDRFAGAACECYVFDQVADGWFMWTDDGWVLLNAPPPAPHGVWAGIGSQELLVNGKTAIRSLLGYSSPLQAPAQTG